MDAKGLAVPLHGSSVLRIAPGCWATRPAGSIILFDANRSGRITLVRRQWTFLRAPVPASTDAVPEGAARTCGTELIRYRQRRRRKLRWFPPPSVSLSASLPRLLTGTPRRG